MKYLTKNHLGKLCQKYKLQEEEVKSLIENSEDENKWTRQNYTRNCKGLNLNKRYLRR